MDRCMKKRQLRGAKPELLGTSLTGFGDPQAVPKTILLQDFTQGILVSCLPAGPRDKTFL